MYHQDPTFIVTPITVQDDQDVRNLHQLALPQWLYVRFPGTLKPREDLVSALNTLLGPVLLNGTSLQLTQCLSDEDCDRLRVLAHSFGCELKASWRSNAEHKAQRQRAYATRTGSTQGGPR